MPDAGIPCVFCSDACEQMDHYGELGSVERPSYLIAKIDGFRILSDNAPLAPGHLLLVPFEHTRSTALLPAHRLEQAAHMVSALLAGLAAQSPDGAHGARGSMVFEHGTGTDPNDSFCCLAHAHLHLLPVGVRVTEWFEERGVPRIGDISSLDGLARAGGAEYLFVQRHGESGDLWDSRGLPSQILRRLVGQALGVTVWNWHDRIVLQSAQERVAEICESLAVARRAVDEALLSDPAWEPRFGE